MVMLNIHKKRLKKPAMESELDLEPLTYVKFALHFSGVSLTCANITAEILLHVRQESFMQLRSSLVFQVRGYYF